jgi:hypothetical protein
MPTEVELERIRADARAAAKSGRMAALEAAQIREQLRPQIEAIRAQAERLRAMCAENEDACDVDIEIVE